MLTYIEHFSALDEISIMWNTNIVFRKSKEKEMKKFFKDLAIAAVNTALFWVGMNADDEIVMYAALAICFAWELFKKQKQQ